MRSRDQSTNQEKANVIKRIICNHKKTKVSLPVKISNIKKSEVVRDGPLPTTAVTELSVTQQLRNIKAYMDADVTPPLVGQGLKVKSMAHRGSLVNESPQGFQGGQG